MVCLPQMPNKFTCLVIPIYSMCLIKQATSYRSFISTNRQHLKLVKTMMKNKKNNPRNIQELRLKLRNVKT